MTAVLSSHMSKVAAGLALLIAVLLAIAFFAWLAVAQVNAMVDRAVTSTVAERNAHWTSQIDAASRRAAENVIAQMRISREIEMEARASVDQIQSELNELEKANAALPDDTRSGIDHDRVRLLRNNRAE